MTGVSSKVKQRRDSRRTVRVRFESDTVKYKVLAGRTLREGKAVGGSVEEGECVEEESYEYSELYIPRLPILNFKVKVEGKPKLKTLPYTTTLLSSEWEEASTIEIPRIPYINILEHTKVKGMDRRIYITTSMLRGDREPIIPRCPTLSIDGIRLKGMDRTLTNLNKRVDSVDTIPKQPKLPSTNINVRGLDKELKIEIRKQPSIMGNTTTQITYAKEALESKESYIPHSLLDIVFEKDVGYGAGELLNISSDHPVVIIAVKPANEDYIGMLMSILREIYRIRVGGLPHGRYFGRGRVDTVGEEPITPGYIWVVDDELLKRLLGSGVKTCEDIVKEKVFETLRDRLIEQKVQGLSFTVFYVNEDNATSLLSSIKAVKIRDKLPPVIVIRPRRLDTKLKRELARISWGFVEPSEPITKDTIDQHFNLREKRFLEILEKITSKRKYVEVVEKSCEHDEYVGESELHYRLKVFLVYYLVEKKKIPIEDIETEAKGFNGVVPDVYVKSKRIAIEVETFYGTGVGMWRKLQRTIEKYLNRHVVNELWIVIPPLQVMLYLRDLVDKVKELREKGYEFIKFYTIDLHRIELVPIENIPKRLSRLLTKLATLK